MNSFNKTWNKSYSESDLITSFSETTFSPMRSPVMIRRTVCMEEVVPSFVPIETEYYNKISSPHRRKNYQQYKTSINLNKSPFPEEIQFQIANLNLTNNEFNNSFSSFSYCPPKALCLENGNTNPLFNQNTSADVQPMEVDSFKDSKNISKIEELNDENFTNNIKNDYVSPILKQENVVRLRNLRVQPFQSTEICDKVKTDQKKKSQFKKLFVTILTVAIIVGASYSISTDLFLNILDLDLTEFDLKHFKNDLTKVYKQDHAISVIISNLENRKTWKKNKKLLTFFGPSGVGKTFVTNILKANFPKRCVHEIDGRFLENNTAEHRVLDNLKSHTLNLVIIDDVKISSIKNLVNFIKAVDSHKEVLTIAVFSTVQVDENLVKTINDGNIDRAENELKNHGLDHEMVLFNNYCASDIKIWIKNQLVLHKIPAEHHEKIVVNVIQDYDIKLNGLKGLHSKIVLEN